VNWLLFLVIDPSLPQHDAVVMPISAKVAGGRGRVDPGCNALCEACRVLMSRGIIGSFETRKPGINYPCMTGDIEKTAGFDC
jgi:hypothetical protein